MSVTSVLNLLGECDSIRIPKFLIETIGLDEALVLVEIAQDYDYWEKKELAEDGWIYPTPYELSKRLHFTKPKQWKILDRLEQMGLVIIEKHKKISKGFKGACPGKRYIRVNEEALKNMLIWNEE